MYLILNFDGWISGFSLSKWMRDKIEGPVLHQWAIDLLKSELKLSTYLNDPMCKRTNLLPGAGNWNVKGENYRFGKCFFLIHCRKC
jgi:hypothetical protein